MVTSMDETGKPDVEQTKSADKSESDQKNSLKRSNQSTDSPPTQSVKTPLASLLTVGPRRSSSRSIKRPKFDDELVDTTSGSQKKSTARKSTDSSPSEARPKKNVTKQISTQSSTTTNTTKKKVKKMKPNPVPKDFGRWRPTDDLKLISAVTQTCDLQTVHMAVSFSCKFTMNEIQERWFALLYDPLVSRLAQQSIKALPSDVVNDSLKNPLWSRDEECLLADISMDSDISLDTFDQLLADNATVFHISRTGESLKDHWLLLRQYQLLNCQSARSTSSVKVPSTLHEMENKAIEQVAMGTDDDNLNQELVYADRLQKREIRKLEKELPLWSVMIENAESCEGLSVVDFKDSETLAVLKGRILKYFINKTKITIGRCCSDFEVDVDLSIEGPALKISRRQGVLSYDECGFKLLNCGKRPFYVNGTPLPFGSSVSLINNSIIEIHCMKLLFEINPLLFDVEAQKMHSATPKLTGEVMSKNAVKIEGKEEKCSIND